VNTLVDLVHCADLAYDETYCLKGYDDVLGAKITPLFDGQKNETRGFVRTTKEQVVVAFMGTKTPADFLTDALLVLEQFAKGKVHAGFKNECMKVWPQVRELVSYSTPLYVTGHSLGGALAELAAMKVKLDLGIDPEVATFGCPYVGDPEWVEAYTALVPKNTRVVHKLDIVPRTPPPELGYKQTEGMLQLTDEGKIIGPVRNWLVELFRFGEDVKSVLNGEGLEDHDRKKYVAAVEAWDWKYNEREKAAK